MPETRSAEIEQLKKQIADLTDLVRGSTNLFHVPDPIKQLSEFTGNKKELTIWLDEVDQLYNTFAIKGDDDEPDTMNAYYVQAIKNKIKGEARITLCANGNPNTIPEIKKVLLQHYGDRRDIATNLNLLFNIKKGDKSHLKFYNETKELETRIKSNLQVNPLTSVQLLEKIIITKYLDNINEPLASIIRSANPNSMEEAFQLVTLNQNAEIRKPSAKPNLPYFKNNINNSRTPNEAKQNAGPSQQKNKQSFKPANSRPKFKPEVNTNVVKSDDESDDEYVDVDDDNDDIELDATQPEPDELNFQTVRLRNKPI